MLAKLLLIGRACDIPARPNGVPDLLMFAGPSEVQAPRTRMSQGVAQQSTLLGRWDRGRDPGPAEVREGSRKASMADGSATEGLERSNSSGRDGGSSLANVGAGGVVAKVCGRHGSKLEAHVARVGAGEQVKRRPWCRRRCRGQGPWAAELGGGGGRSSTPPQRLSFVEGQSSRNRIEARMVARVMTRESVQSACYNTMERML